MRSWTRSARRCCNLASAADTLRMILNSRSDSIYLWHIPVREFGLGSLRMAVGGPLPLALELGLFVAGSIVVGIAMAKLVEMPALRLRDRMFPSMSKPLTRPAPGRAIRPTDAVWVRGPIVKSHPSNDSGSPRMS